MAETATPAIVSTPAKPYAIIGAPVHTAQFNEALDAVQQGWRVKAQWLATGSVIVVFVPDTADLPSTADALIRFQGAQLDQLHALGAQG